MNARRVIRKLVLLAGLALSLPAAAQVPGVTATEIKIGQTAPYSGPASLAAPVALVQVAYFKMINEQGGINGRKINLLSLDDGYSPPKAVEMTRKLVEQDQVLLVFGQVGTAVTAAAQVYLNAKGVPQLFSSGGASRFNDPKKFPWTIGTSASYRGEAVQFGQYIRKHLKAGKVGILYQNDDLGRDYTDGLALGLGDLAATSIVAKESFDVSAPTIDSQILQLRASGADILVVAAIAKPTVMALRKLGDLGWKPQVLLSLASTSYATVMQPAGLKNGIGVISTTVYKDPSDKRWEKDPEYLRYVDMMKKYAPELSVNDHYAVSGYITAQFMADVIRRAGSDLSRENIRKVVTSTVNYRPEMAGPEVVFTLTPSDYEMFKSLQFMRFNGEAWEPFDAQLK